VQSRDPRPDAATHPYRCAYTCDCCIATQNRL